MKIEWKENLSVGVKEIDDQHKELFKRANDLFEACGRATGKEEVKKVTAFLSDYIVKHFICEETIQKEHNYPDYISHKKEHEKFTRDFTELKKQLEKEGSTGLFVIKVNKLITEWLLQHIGKADKEIGLYLNKAN